MSLVVAFSGAVETTLSDVGGKALSLIRMTEAGLPVPPGWVLTTDFFAPWFDRIMSAPPWRTLADATPAEWATLCPQLQALCPALPLTPAQRQAIDALRSSLAASGDDALFAVRSSSPEEDLASASFAGGYETRLGVRPENVDDAVRHCFASSLDERVLVYKREHGFDVLSPRIAVVIQQQIDSDVAGVGFSINPLTNDYDEAVINANFGLGESVVAGLATPDHFVVDKVRRRVIARTTGSKQLSIRLDPGGGTVERADHSRAAELTLDDDRLLELTDMMCRIEQMDERPVDIEWAYADGRLHVLQVRPVTAYVPLPPQMLTAPGDRRLLYGDIALSSGLTINAPISPLGLDWMRDGVAIIAELVVGRRPLDHPLDEAFWFFAGGRMYQNLSNVLWLAGPKTLSKSAMPSDTLMAETLGAIDKERYRAPVRPPWARLRMLRFLPGALWRLRRGLWYSVWALLAPERAHRAYRREIEAIEAEISEIAEEGFPLDESRRRPATRVMRHLFDVEMPALMVALIGLKMVDVLFRRASVEVRELAERLTFGFPGNAVVEMGIAMHRLARMLGPTDYDDLPGLAERIEGRRMPAGFLTEWDAFIAEYGCRGPLEMDLARPRYADDPQMALRQMRLMAADGGGFDPEAAQRRRVDDRRRAFEELVRRIGPVRRALLRRAHRLIDLFAGTRDTPKHHNLMVCQVLRRRLLEEGRRLVEAGRLDHAEDVFDLTFDDLDAAVRDPDVDLRAVGAERTRFIASLGRHVRTFPGVIDSRGRILRPPPRAERPGELTGMPVSPGVVTGPVKVLDDPEQKPVDPGDVLVAYTTDPGWTPLFANAAAVVLEVGGVLQHGAVVAREYGKPCVAGIDRVTTRLHDGQVVEVDGTAGVVRICEEPGAES